MSNMRSRPEPERSRASGLDEVVVAVPLGEHLDPAGFGAGVRLRDGDREVGVAAGDDQEVLLIHHLGALLEDGFGGVRLRRGDRAAGLPGSVPGDLSLDDHPLWMP
jgi:hypothetical protein